ncbi:t-SNARE family protein [Pelomyxa schiedti]|nr:t-SNARE family protein [Pelomyxa schiedti]
MQDRLSELRDIGGDPAQIEADKKAAAQAAAEAELAKDPKAKAKRDKELKAKGKDKDTGEVDLEAKPPEDPAFMPDFFDEIDAVKKDMATVRSNIEEIRALSKDAVTAVKSPEALAETSKKLATYIEESNILVQKLKMRLDQMKQNNETHAKENSKATTELRIRANTLSTLTTKFVALMKEYNEVQAEYQKSTKEKFSRQCKIVKPDASQAEIDQAMESGDVQIFTSAVLSDQEHLEDAQAALAYVENKHHDILRLAQSINELHQMFVDMAVLVDAQQELLDNIELNCENALKYVKEGVVELKEANVLQKKSRKKMCIIFAILIVIVLVIVIAAALGGGLSSIF